MATGASGGSTMTALALRLLGDMAVLRDGEAQPLPPSRKTRALLAYLALNPGSVRREHLCELLWEIPDDPRGALRWSLSKLRRLVDDGRQRRIVADRCSVQFEAQDVAIDVVALHALAASGPDSLATDRLAEAVERYRGHFLEGLELTGLHDFHAWCVAERERVSRAQAALLRSLVARLAATPAQALPHAHALAALTPYDEAARVTLIQLLVRLGRRAEAEQQYRLGRRLLAEVGQEPSERLYRAWRGPPGGRAAPTRPAPASPAATIPATPRAGGEALFGRDAELALITQAFTETARDGRTRVLLLCGEPGIGKTRLLEAAAGLAREAGALCLQAEAFEAEMMRPYALWLDALRALHPERADTVFGDGGSGDRQRLLNRLSDLVAQETATRPLALLFDDLQWCDESSAAALHYVLRTNPRRPLFTVLAARTDEVQDNAAVQRAIRSLRRDGRLLELPLPPLAEPAVRELIATRAPAADSQRLGRECGGNPLLAIELARAEGTGSGSLQDLVHERLARLDVDGVEVLRWAALIAPRIGVPALERLTGLDRDRIAAALESAEQQALLRSSPRGLHFAHDLIARSIYNEIPPARRRVMHRRVAEWLEEGAARDLEQAADLAHHAAHSGDAALAARGMVSAGRLCLRFFANEDAANLARKGLQLAGELAPPEAICLALELREVLYTATSVSDWEAAADQCVALAEQALEHGALAHARLGYQTASYLRWAHGQWSGAREESLQAERITRGADAREQITGMAETAKCLVLLERDLDRARGLLAEAGELARRQGIRHHALPAGLGMLHYHAGELDLAEEHFHEARTLCRSAGDRLNEFQANEYLVMIAFERGRLEDACRRCHELIALGERLREGSEAPFARVLQALCLYAREGDPAPLDQALETLREADALHRLAYALTRAAFVDLQRGDPGRASERAEEALAHAERLGRATETLLARVALAQACAERGDSTACARHRAAVQAFDGLPVAQWARRRAAALQPAEA